MKFLYSLLLCTITFVILGCSKKNPSEPATINKDICSGCLEAATNGQLIPLAVGNRWVYEYNRYDTLGNLLVSDSIVTVWVEQKYIIDDVEYYVIAYHGTSGESYTYVHARNSAEGFCVGHVAVTSNLYLYRLYKYPAELEERYNNSDSTPPVFGWQVFWLESDSEQVVVDAGTFDCLYYFGYPVRCSSGGQSLYYAAPMSPIWGCYPQPGLSGEEHQWYKHYVSPGVGVIRQIMYIVSEGPRTIQEWNLKEYSLK